jgi:hypothetical protein
MIDHRTRGKIHLQFSFSLCGGVYAVDVADGDLIAHGDVGERAQLQTAALKGLHGARLATVDTTE